MNSEKVAHTILKLLFAVPLLLLGLAWLYTFIFTNYRAGQKPLGILCGVFATFLGIVLLGWAIAPWRDQKK
jgi:hypothetical protein